MSADTESKAGSRRWPLGPVRTMLAVTLLLSGLFLLFPGLDLWFTGLFYDPATGFPASDVPLLQWLRSLADDTVWIIVIGSIASLLAKLVLPERPSLIPPRSSLFLLSTLIIGPGILVNAILKAHWGRPRPFMIAQFGGDLPFVGVWRITDFCDGNCSFVSGEASSAIWLLALALVVPVAWRARVAAGALIVALVFSLNRVAFGAHFLSDVLLSWALTLTVIAVVHHYLFARPLPGLSNTRIEGALTRAGRWIRHPFGSGPERR